MLIAQDAVTLLRRMARFGLGACPLAQQFCRRSRGEPLRGPHGCFTHAGDLP